MKSDFSRISFDSAHQFTAVLHQQGRVLTDADFNEQSTIHAHMYESLAASLTGTEGAIWMEPSPLMVVEPRHVPGFFIWRRPKTENPRGTGKLELKSRLTVGQTEEKDPFAGVEWWISPGHYYAGGLRVENDAWVPLGAQPFLPDAATQVPEVDENAGVQHPGWLLYLDAWERPLSWLDQPRISDIALGGTVDTAQRTQIVWQVKSLDMEKVFAEAGGITEQGINFEELSARLPWRRRRPRLRVRIKPDAVSNDPCRPALASAWQGQANQLYRVEIHNGSPAVVAPPAEDPKTGKSLATRGGKVPGKGQDVPKEDYKPAWPVTFKWSRENGSVAAKIAQISGEAVMVFPGQLKAGGIRKGDRVELVRSEDDLTGKPGDMLIVSKVQGDRVTFESTSGLAKAPAAGDKLRRWDQRPCDGTVLPVAHEWVELEQGIEVLFEPAEDATLHDIEIQGHESNPACFAGTEFRTGDYWVFTARTATAAVDWPLERVEPDTIPVARSSELAGLPLHLQYNLLTLPAAWQAAPVPVRRSGQPPEPVEKAPPAALPPHGVRHRYAMLAAYFFERRNDDRRNGWTLRDARRIFNLCGGVMTELPKDPPKPSPVEGTNKDIIGALMGNIGKPAETPVVALDKNAAAEKAAPEKPAPEKAPAAAKKTPKKPAGKKAPDSGGDNT